MIGATLLCWFGLAAVCHSWRWALSTCERRQWLPVGCTALEWIEGASVTPSGRVYIPHGARRAARVIPARPLFSED